MNVEAERLSTTRHLVGCPLTAFAALVQKCVQHRVYSVVTPTATVCTAHGSYSSDRNSTISMIKQEAYVGRTGHFFLRGTD